MSILDAAPGSAIQSQFNSIPVERKEIPAIPYEITITLTIPYMQNARLRETKGMVSTDFSDIINDIYRIHGVTQERAPGASLSVDDSPANGWDINEVLQICPNCETAIPRIKYMTEADYAKWKDGLVDAEATDEPKKPVERQIDIDGFKIALPFDAPPLDAASRCDMFDALNKGHDSGTFSVRSTGKGDEEGEVRYTWRKLNYDRDTETWA